MSFEESLPLRLRKRRVLAEPCCLSDPVDSSRMTLGLLPQIEARERPNIEIWVDLTLKSGSQTLEGQKFKAGDAELEFRPCPADSGAPEVTNPPAE